MIPFKSIYDITVLLGEESITYPGDPVFLRELVTTLKDQGDCELSRLSMSSHSGTHMDAPSHFIQGGKSIDRYGPEDFMFSAVILETKDDRIIHPKEMKNIRIDPGDALLFKTENSRSGRCKSGAFSQDYVYLSEEAADLCIEKGVGLIGIDYITIDRYNDATFAIHHKILGNNILILEGIDLSEVPPGRFTLFCPALKIKNGEASPVRAFLLA